MRRAGDTLKSASAAASTSGVTPASAGEGGHVYPCCSRSSYTDPPRPEPLLLDVAAALPRALPPPSTRVRWLSGVVGGGANAWKSGRACCRWCCVRGSDRTQASPGPSVSRPAAGVCAERGCGPAARGVRVDTVACAEAPRGTAGRMSVLPVPAARVLAAGAAPRCRPRCALSAAHRRDGPRRTMVDLASACIASLGRHSAHLHIVFGTRHSGGVQQGRCDVTPHEPHTTSRPPMWHTVHTVPLDAVPCTVMVAGPLRALCADRCRPWLSVAAALVSSSLAASLAPSSSLLLQPSPLATSEGTKSSSDSYRRWCRRTSAGGTCVWACGCTFTVTAACVSAAALPPRLNGDARVRAMAAGRRIDWQQRVWQVHSQRATAHAGVQTGCAGGSGGSMGYASRRGKRLICAPSVALMDTGTRAGSIEAHRCRSPMVQQSIPRHMRARCACCAHCGAGTRGTSLPLHSEARACRWTHTSLSPIVM